MPMGPFQAYLDNSEGVWWCALITEPSSEGIAKFVNGTVVYNEGMTYPPYVQFRFNGRNHIAQFGYWLCLKFEDGKDIRTLVVGRDEFDQRFEKDEIHAYNVFRDAAGFETPPDE